MPWHFHSNIYFKQENRGSPRKREVGFNCKKKKKVYIKIIDYIRRAGVHCSLMFPENSMSCRPTLGTSNIYHPPSDLILESHFLWASHPVRSMPFPYHFLVSPTTTRQGWVVIHLSPHCPEVHLLHHGTYAIWFGVCWKPEAFWHQPFELVQVTPSAWNLPAAM